jgi:lipopolysaccharide export system permease protein
MDGLKLMWPMLFDSSLRRELWRSFIGTLVVLMTVVLTMVLIRVLSQATRGAFAPADVSLILSYTLVGQLPVLMALALFVSVVAVLSRMWRESEMVVWQASGASQMNFITPLLRMAWPVIALVALCTLVARPWAQTQAMVLKVQYDRRSDMARVAPGQFQSSADGKRVFFIDSTSDTQKTGRNVFMVMTDSARESVVTAKEGRVEIDKGQRYLLLDQGERVQTDLITGAKTLSSFVQARLLLGEAPDPSRVNVDLRATSTPALLLHTEREARGELVWRVGLIWACLNMVLSGLSLASGNARRHSSWNLVNALLLFVVYFNLINLSQNWVARGKMSWPVSLWLIHGMLTLGALTVIWWRDGKPMPARLRAAPGAPA